MIKYFILLVAFFVHSLAATTQQLKVKNDSLINKYRIDSINRLLAGAPDDTLKVWRLLEISELQYDPKKVISTFAEAALALAEKLNFKRGIAAAKKEKGYVFQKKNNYDSGIIYYQQAIDVTESGGYNGNSSEFYSALYNLYFHVGDYPKAMIAVNKEKKLAENTNDKKWLTGCYNIQGYINFKQEDTLEALKYYNLYIESAKELKDSIALAHGLGEISDLYIWLKKYNEAKAVLYAAIRICDQLLHDPGTQDTPQVIAKLPQFKAKNLHRLGKVYKLTGDLPKALENSLAAITAASHIPAYDYASYLINIGDIYKEMRNFKKAFEYLKLGYDTSRKMQHNENMRDAAEYLSQTYALQHRYDSAFYYYKEYTSLKDAILNNESRIKTREVERQSELAKKDKEITRQQQIRNILIGGFIFFLIVLLLLYNGYRLRQKNKTQQEYNRQQNELFNAIVSTQDQERKRIAQDIHDSLGSVLSAAKLKLSSLEESKKLLSADQLEKYQATLSLLDEASTDLRNISHNIMPATLSKLGLVAALQNLIGKISSRSGLQVIFTTHELEERIEETTEISIYRIILELINNIVKHAAADKVSIQLIKYPAYINLVVEDNGRGFDYERSLEEKKGIGLGNILSRVEYLKGTIDIDSSPGKGTTVIIEIPYKS